jgi:hypothetical protein
MDHPFGNLVDGAIASRCQNEFGAAADVFARDGRGGARPRGRGDGYGMPLMFKDLDGSLEQVLPMPSEFPRARVVNQDGLPVALDDFLRFFWSLGAPRVMGLVKL